MESVFHCCTSCFSWGAHAICGPTSPRWGILRTGQDIHWFQWNYIHRHIQCVCHCLNQFCIDTYKRLYIRIYSMLEIKPCGLASRIRDVESFWYKTEIKIIYFVPLCLIVFDRMVHPDPKFLIFKTKKRPHIFSEVRDCFFILCYHARHFLKIHWNENFCRIYGLGVIASVATLNICQILMR